MTNDLVGFTTAGVLSITPLGQATGLRDRHDTGKRRRIADLRRPFGAEADLLVVLFGTTPLYSVNYGTAPNALPGES